jgi:hypothetical protein
VGEAAVALASVAGGLASVAGALANAVFRLGAADFRAVAFRAMAFGAVAFRAVAFRAAAFRGLAFRRADRVGDFAVADPVSAVPGMFVSELDPVDPVDVSSAITCLLLVRGHCPLRRVFRPVQPC